MKKFFVICILFLIYHSFASAVLFEKISFHENIGNIRAKSICTDSIGQMWVGTNLGLFSYDGQQMRRHILLPEIYGKSSQVAYNIVYNKKNNCLYLLLHSYLVEYDLKTYKSRQISDKRFYCFTGGEIFFLAHEDVGDIYEYANDTIRKIAELPQKTGILSLLKADSLLYIGTKTEGVFVMNDKMKITKLGKELMKVSSLFKDSQHNIWVSSDGGGLMKITPSNEYISYLSGMQKDGILLPSNSVRAVQEDNNNNLWIATSEGICRYHLIDKSFDYSGKTKQDESGLTSPSIWSLAKDKQGSIWMGSYAGNIYIYNSHNSIFSPIIVNKSSLNRNLMLGKIIRDKYNTLWIASEWNGLYSYNIDTKRINNYSNLPLDNKSLSSNNVKTIYYDNNRDLIWAGCHNAGLCRINPSNGETKRFVSRCFPLVNTAQIHSLIPYGDKILFGTNIGVFAYEYDTDEVNIVDKKLDMFSTNITMDDNKLWINATSELICYDMKTSKLTKIPFLDPTTKHILTIVGNEMVIDSQKRLWISTRGDGLICYNIPKRKFEIYDESCGLKEKFIFAIFESNDNQMIVSSNRGLSILDLVHKRCSHYTSDKGLAVTSMHPGGIYFHSDGNIFLSGENGLFSVKRWNLFGNYQSFRMWFSGLKINNEVITPDLAANILPQAIEYTKSLTLNHRQNIVSFSFASDNYVKANNIVYEYKLDGFDKGWLTAPADFELSYMNLNPGKYTLRVRGYSVNHPSNSQEILLNIRILPHPLLSIWAYIIYFIIIFVAAWQIIKAMKVRLQLRNSLYLAGREKEQIENVNQSKLRFFTNISHEFRTPITLIIGQLQMVMQSNLIPPALYQRILNIYRNASKMQELITELIDFRKQEQGFLMLKVSEEKLAPLIEEVFLSFSDYAMSKQIEYSFENNAGELKVLLDQVQFRKVVFNLISNAFKYNVSKGGIVVSVEKGETSFALKVKDSGMGIPEDLIEKIFDRFYQVEQTSISDSVNSGSGIGLALAKGVVEAHNGTIHVRSEINKGSEFTVEIPYDLSELEKKGIIKRVEKRSEDVQSIQSLKDFEFDNQSTELDEIKQKINAKTSILIIEDNDELCNMLENIFSQFSTVHCASNGQDGLDCLSQVGPDLIISDVMMPRVSGTELCQRVKQNKDWCHVPIILLTACSTVEQNIDGLKCGADDYITKPFNISILITRSLNLIHSRQILRERFSKEITATPVTVTTNGLDQCFLEEAMSIVEKNIESEEFSIPFLARELKMSQRSFFNKLKALTGKTPLEFVTTVRLRVGAHLLIEKPTEKIATIAYSIGFSNPKNFTASFKEQFGMTPSQYQTQFLAKERVRSDDTMG